MNLSLGCALIAFGLSIIINIIFGINIPIFKIFFAAFLIYLGVKMLMPSSCSSFCYFSSCGESSQKTEPVLDDKNTYSVCFSSSVIDLSHLTTHTAPETITINTQCAHVVVLLPKGLPVRVKADVRCGAVNLPGCKMGSEYVNLHGALEPRLTMYIKSQFSNVIVKE